MRGGLLEIGLLTTTSLAGFGLENQPNNPAPPITIEDAQLEELGYQQVNDNSLGEIWFGFREGSDVDIASLQYIVGSIANHQILEMEQIPVQVNETLYTAVYSIPDDDVPRIYDYVPDSSEFGGSATDQQLVRNEEGQLKLISARGIIGQETEGAGLMAHAAVELCQGLDLEIIEPTSAVPVEPDTYTRVKEGICNSFGIAIDRSFLDIPFEDYKDEISGQVLSEPAAHGATVYFTLIDQVTYERFGASIDAALETTNLVET